MILKGKKVVIMGVRNKWSIAWGAARSAYEQGAEVICTSAEENVEKVKKLLEELPEVLSISYGISRYDPASKEKHDLEQVIKEADKEMYYYKRKKKSK